jgi:16S rRNA (guanine527-N7)-methyltransferase
VVEALSRAQRLGFFGDGPLEPAVDHARGFAEAAAAFHARQGAPDWAGPGCFVDLGSGGGLPGLVLAALWPRATGIFLDANERRSAHLVQAVEEAGWQDRITVLQVRAEVAGRRQELRGAADLVVARSFGAPAATAECAAPLLRVGGLLIVSEPPAGAGAGAGALVPGSDRWPPGPLAELGLRPVGEERGRYGYQLIVQERACPERFPRRDGVPAKRPLYR